MSYIHDDLRQLVAGSAVYQRGGAREVIVERRKAGGMFRVMPRGRSIATEPVTVHRSSDRAADRIGVLMRKTW